MTRRKKQVALIAAVLAVAIATVLAVPRWRRAILGPRGEEAVYDGQPTTYWRQEIVRLQRGVPPEGVMGTALVWLGLAEDRNDAGFRMRYPPLTIPGPPMLKPPPPDPGKLAVVLQLIEDDDGDIRAYAACFLGEFAASPVAVMAATRLLDDADASVRLAATQALARIGPRARAALPRLAELTRDTAEEYHVYAAHALWRIGRHKDEAVVVLARALRGPDVLHRQRAMDLLAEMGADAKGAFAELAATSRDGDRLARMYALRLLGKFGKRSVPVVMAGLADTDAVVRGWAIEALANTGPDAGAAVPAVVRLRDHDGEKHVRDSATAALPKLDPEHFALPAPKE